MSSGDAKNSHPALVGGQFGTSADISDHPPPKWGQIEPNLEISTFSGLGARDLTSRCIRRYTNCAAPRFFWDAAMTEAHHASDLPAIPFTDADIATMFQEDKKAAWDIARLTGGIFTFGLVLYTGVMLWMLSSSP